MAKALRCTGYALAGAVVMVGVVAGFGLLITTTMAVGEWFGLGKDAQAALAFITSLAAFGAFIGGAMCREKYRYEK